MACSRSSGGHRGLHAVPLRLVIAAAVALSCLASAGCVYNVKTSAVPRFSALEELDPSEVSQRDFEIAMGSPTSQGLHILDGEALSLTFHYGLIGKLELFPAKSASLDSGMAFASFHPSGKLQELTYFASKFDGPKIPMGGELPIDDIAAVVEVGLTRIGQLETTLGEPSYRGRRFSATTGVEHELAFFDFSASGSSEVYLERWLLVGFDHDEVVRDLIWASSYKSDIASLGDVEPVRARKMTRMDASFPFPLWATESISTSTRLDRVQVEALIESAPSTVGEYVVTLGKPTALGFKVLEDEDPLLLSQWTYLVTKHEGNEDGPRLPLVEGEDPESNLVNYMVMHVEMTRLMIAHTPDGSVKEVIWFRPGEPIAHP